MTSKQERPAGERDDVARLIRLAGKRPQVPAERAKRVEHAVREHWRREVGRRSSGRYVWLAAALASAVAIVAIWFVAFRSTPLDPAPALAELRIETVRGTVWAAGAGDPLSRVALAAGDRVTGDRLLMTGDDGRIAARLASGHSLRIDAGSRLRLNDASTVALESGALYIDSGPGAAGGPALTVRTVFATIEEIGTQFEVRLDSESMTVRVREGSVVVESARERHEVGAENALTVASDGSAERTAIEPFGAAWGWVEGIGPRPSLEGLSARAFLDWVAREQGRRLQFADPELLRSADQIELRGSVAGLSLEQALDAVLPTCGMTYRLEDGRLVIEGFRQP